MLKFSTCYESDPPDEVVRGLIEDEKKLSAELRMVSPEHTKLWQGLLTLPRRRPDRSPAPTPAGTLAERRGQETRRTVTRRGSGDPRRTRDLWSELSLRVLTWLWGKHSWHPNPPIEPGQECPDGLSRSFTAH